MSIASRITSIENHLSNDYTEIARLGADLTNVDKNIENIAEAIREAYSKMPKVLGTGSNLSLSPTLKGGLDITPIGNCEQDSYSGKNLFDEAQLLNATGWSVNNGVYSGVIDNWYSQFKNGFAITFEENTQYTISLKGYTSGGTPRLKLVYSDSTSEQLNINATSITSYTKTSTSGKTLSSIQADFGTGSSNTLYLTEFMIEKGTSATSYEPYVGGIPSPNPDYPQDIRVVTGDNDVVVQNKNLLNRTTCTENYALYWNNGNPMAENTSIITDYIKVVPNNNYAMLHSGQILFYDINKNYLGALQSNNTIAKTTSTFYGPTFSVPNNDDIYYVRLGFRSAYNTGVDLLNANLQLELGSTATSYVPHAEQKVTLHLGTNYLAGIGDYVDTIVGKTDDWKIVRNVGKVVLDGSEDWHYNSTYGVFYTTSLSNYSRIAFIPYSNYFKGVTSVSSVSAMSINNTLAFNTVDTDRLFIKNEDFSNVTDFKNWLSTHNVILYYQLETSTEEPVLDTTLINDLNNMYNLMGYDGQTNITITSNSSNAQMTAQVKALKGE